IEDSFQLGLAARELLDRLDGQLIRRKGVIEQNQLSPQQGIGHFRRPEELPAALEAFPLRVDLPYRRARLGGSADRVLPTARRRLPEGEVCLPGEGLDTVDVLLDEPSGLGFDAHHPPSVDPAASVKSRAMVSAPRAKFSMENHSSGAWAFAPGR